MTMLEFETEPVKGIPGQLPSDERVLWQGVPTWRSLMVHVLHVRWLAAYFAVIMVWRAGWHLAEGNGWAVASSSAAWLGVLGLFVATLMAGVALLMKRSTVYTITSKRLILRFGMVVPMAVNVPFAKIEAVDLKKLGDGTGEIPITVGGNEQFVYGLMWPHVQRWQFIAPRPMLRSIPDPIKVAGILANAVAKTLGETETAAPRPALRPNELSVGAMAASSAGSGSAMPSPA